MAKNIFIVPVVKRNALHCAWIKTGDPAQPLRCVWTHREPRTAAEHEHSEARLRAVCA